MWTCRRWRNTSCLGYMLSELECSSMEIRWEQSSLTFFHKIYFSTLSIDNEKYLTPVSSLSKTWISQTNDSQNCSYLAYSGVLKKKSFSPELFHIGIVLLLPRLVFQLQRGLRLMLRVFMQSVLACHSLAALVQRLNTPLSHCLHVFAKLKFSHTHPTWDSNQKWSASVAREKIKNQRNE